MSSDMLGESYQVNVTAHALRCIRKHGSLDMYLLNTKDHNIKSQFGLELKQRLKVLSATARAQAVDK